MFNTVTWLRTLGNRFDGDLAVAAVARLKNAFEIARDRAAMLAMDIPRDMPEYTIHDVTHLDALWEMTDVLAGDKYPITPPEAFVLGCAFLVHDLGMTISAYPGGIEEIKRQSVWKDTVATLLRKRLQRAATAEELASPPEEVVKAATSKTLRLLHADRAATLLVEPWYDARTGNSEFLIGDSDLRNSLGALAGKVAASHWWAIERVRSEFSMVLGAPVWCPRDWTVDALKLAGILRTADAAHIDARRAPAFIRILRQLSNVSEQHWVFQGRLSKPYLDGDRLVYSTSQGFGVQDIDAWWLCYDALSMIDTELRAVDAMFFDERRPLLAARGVAGVANVERLQRHIPTQGWMPVDTSLRIGNVAKLVQQLGGKMLYGTDYSIPLRELIQNAADAVRARRIEEGRSETWGDIEVHVGQDGGGERWLEVRDCGIGMSVEVLSGVLLDFGASYWGSDLMQREHPGLASSSFEPGGVFGIGFFSVFIWGRRVRVVTRRPSDPVSACRSLEFHSGLFHRPTLRTCEPSECLMEPGTAIRVWFDAPESVERLLGGEERRFADVVSLCQYMCFALDVNLWVSESTKSRSLAVPANWWKTAPMRELLERIVSLPEDAKVPPTATEISLVDVFEHLADCSSDMVDESGRLLGRATVLTSLDFEIEGGTKSKPAGVVVAGGMRAQPVLGVAGILVGAPIVVSREMALPLADSTTISRWAADQARIAERDGSLTDIERFQRSHLIAGLEGDTAGLPVAYGSKGWVSREDLRRWYDAPSSIYVLALLKSDFKMLEGLHLPDEFLITDRYNLIWPDRKDPIGRLEMFQIPPDAKVRLDGTWIGPPGRSIAVTYGPWNYNRPQEAYVPKIRGTDRLIAMALCEAWGATTAEVSLSGGLPNEGQLSALPEVVRSSLISSPIVVSVDKVRPSSNRQKVSA